MADYYEDMFYVIQCLSTPEIDGEVNEKQVRLYLSELANILRNMLGGQWVNTFTGEVSHINQM